MRTPLFLCALPKKDLILHSPESWDAQIVSAMIVFDFTSEELDLLREKLANYECNLDEQRDLEILNDLLNEFEKNQILTQEKLRTLKELNAFPKFQKIISEVKKGRK